MPKPTPDEIASKLRRMLSGSDGPDDDDYQCRTMNVSTARFTELCGYEEYEYIPEKLFDKVCLRAMHEYRLLVIAGWHTVLVGDDLHPKSVGPRSS